MSDTPTNDSAKGQPTVDGRDLPFDTIVETINDGILVLRLGGEIIYVNASMARMLGYERQDMVGKMLFDFMSDEWADKARHNLERRSEGVAERFDHQWRRQDGHDIWTYVSAKPMHDGDGRQWGSLVAIQDISERKAMESKLRRAHDDLEQRVRQRTRELTETNRQLNEEIDERRAAEQAALEASRAKSAFLANMSHELRTPLNAVIGYTELVQEDMSAGRADPDILSFESVGRDLSKIHQAANHLLALINDILDLSKVEAGKMNLHVDAVDVAEVVGEVVDTVRPLAADNDNAIVGSVDPIDAFVADRTKLKQVLLNLAGNAAKFTEQGQIEVDASPANIDGRPGVRFEVSDNGMGIGPEVVDRLFEPFTQADESTTRRHGGTGLGLTICKRFCQMMGGDISVDSEPGQGTTFRVDLPSAQVQGLAEASAVGWENRPDKPGPAKVPVARDGEGPMVLIIDDDPDVHEMMRRFLKPQTFQFCSAFDGQQGLERARAVDPDVITLDVMMPGTDGWSVLSSLKADPMLADIPVVMITMVDDQSIGYALGASEYLVKPIQRDRLVQTLARFRPQGGGRALVVEDNGDVRDVVCRHLQRADWNVATAADGVSAVEALEASLPDVVILDLMMPKMDGFELAEKMRQTPAWADIPIVVLTAMDLDEHDQSRLRESVQRIVSKQAGSFDVITDEVRKVVGQQPRLAPD